MSENVYVRGESNSNFEAMTKEEVLAAIVLAIQGGTVGDIDSGFVTMIKEQNKGQGLKFWVGTTAEYNALETTENNCLYIKTDDTSPTDINNAITTLQTSLTEQSAAIEALKIPINGIIVSIIFGSSDDAIAVHNFMGYGTWELVSTVEVTGGDDLYFWKRTA